MSFEKKDGEKTRIATLRGQLGKSVLEKGIIKIEINISDRHHQVWSGFIVFISDYKVFLEIEGFEPSMKTLFKYYIRFSAKGYLGKYYLVWE